MFPDPIKIYYFYHFINAYLYFNVIFWGFFPLLFYFSKENLHFPEAPAGGASDRWTPVVLWGKIYINDRSRGWASTSQTAWTEPADGGISKLNAAKAGLRSLPQKKVFSEQVQRKFDVKFLSIVYGRCISAWLKRQPLNFCSGWMFDGRQLLAVNRCETKSVDAAGEDANC